MWLPEQTGIKTIPVENQHGNSTYSHSYMKSYSGQWLLREGEPVCSRDGSPLVVHSQGVSHEHMYIRATWNGLSCRYVERGGVHEFGQER